MSKLADFMKRLHKNTLDGTISWQETFEDDKYQISFPKYTLQILMNEDSTGDISYIVQIFNEEGKLIEDISDYDISNEIPHGFVMMKEIYERARSQAMGLDKALDDIMTYLPPDDNQPSFDDPPF